jgi:hypothetical protein
LAWRGAVRLMRSGRWNQSADELAARGIALAQSLVETAPDTALELLDEAAGILADPEALAAERRGVLERLQAAKPQDVAITVRLAAALADEGNLERAVALLQPLKDKLADTEGARILGQHYAAQGDFAAAYELLAPYCQTRLASYREAEQAFEAQLKATHSRAIQKLQNGAADEAFYRRYESASEAEQNEMVDQYVMEEMQEDVQIPLARERLVREGRIVPVALDFGVVQLERAQSLADPAARQAELTQAEQTFLAVGGAVGETDEYQLNLGKVYYWLGKQEEGRRLFDEILARNAASAEIKLAVAQTMRVVGAEQEARELAEQIFAGETNEEFRNGAARLRSVLSSDAADEVAWLEKVTSTDADQRASLASAKARQAMAAGRDAEAAQFLRESAALYASLPENSSTLNNAAIAYSALYSIEGKREDLAQAADRMTRAVGMMPDNSILMVNAADLLLQQAVADTIADKLDPRVAILFGKLPAISLCYDNEAERQAIQQTLAAHPALAKARQFYERAMLLAPRRADNYEYAADLAKVLDDEAALARIAARIAETPPDTRQTIEEQKKYERGERDADIRERLKSNHAKALALAEVLGGEAPSEQRDRSLAGALQMAAGSHLALVQIGGEEDLNAIVELAERALEARPSSSTRGMLITTLQMRAAKQLAQSQPPFGEMVAAAGRQIALNELIYIALGKPELSSAVAAHPDIRRAGELARDNIANYPESGSAEAALLIEPLDPAVAAQQRQRTVGDRPQYLASQIDHLLSPASAAAGLDWLRQLECAGDSEQADEVIARLVENGVKLP